MSTDKAMVTDEQVRAYKQAYTAHLNALIASKSPDATGDISFEATRVGLLAALSEAEQQPVAAWQWRSRIKGGEWDAWERGRYNQEVPPFMEVEERPLYAHPPSKREAGEAAAPVRDLTGLDEATKQKLREALRFSASRSVMSAEDERRILSAMEAAAPVQDLVGIELAARFVKKRLNDYCAEQGWEDEFNSLSPEQQGKIRHCAERFGVPLIAAYYRAKDLDVIEDTPSPQPREAPPQSDALPSPQQREESR